MEEVRLHIGGKTVREGWLIVDIEKREEVDVVSDAADLHWCETESVSEIYASHVLEHLSWRDAGKAIAEWHRVLKPGGKLMIAVPDVTAIVLASRSPLISTVAVYKLFQAIFGGQVDQHDQHRSGYNDEILRQALQEEGFRDIKRVASFGMFEDCSEIVFLGVPISLNLEATK